VRRSKAGEGFRIKGYGKGEGAKHGRPGWHFKKEAEDLGVRVWRGGSPGISAGDRGGALRARGGCGWREKGPTGGTGLQPAANGVSAGSGALGFGSVERAGWA
jgi:hypothetical protein